MIITEFDGEIRTGRYTGILHNMGLFKFRIQGGMTMKKHLVSLICLLLALLLACPAAVAEAGGTADAAIEKKTYPYLYCFQDDTEPLTSEMNLYFVNGGAVP